MKKCMLALMLLSMLFLLSGCNSNVICSTSDFIITETYDSSGSLVQRSEINRNTGVTTTYLYTYGSDLSSKYCKDIQVVTISSDGAIISSTQ